MNPAHRTCGGRVGAHRWCDPAFLLARRSTLPGVSSLWTPEGEHRVPRPGDPPPGSGGRRRRARRRPLGVPAPLPAPATGTERRSPEEQAAWQRLDELRQPARRHAGRGGGGQPRLRPVRAGRHPPVAAARPAWSRRGWRSTPWAPGRRPRRPTRARPSRRCARPWPRSAWPTSRSEVGGRRQRQRRRGRGRTRRARRRRPERHAEAGGPASGPASGEAHRGQAPGLVAAAVPGGQGEDHRVPPGDASGCRRPSRCSGTGSGPRPPPVTHAEAPRLVELARPRRSSGPPIG